MKKKNAMRIEQMVSISDFPQLSLLAWNLNPGFLLTETEALDLYERNWRYVDAAKLTKKENELIAHLVKTVGKGHLLV